ncbi:hypothetical protein CAPTEDRAFT_221699 [Capitella teleta]|uniref:BHLH domain-containing protein n=1 Tax=Capitella teleta TaxID=283909 RepID=R7TZF2_CAPTE|nr:hypothetical protein CAPTEDRAFT_221699 [Capitella teleta]|eukprot:ELT99022.1 hypothetical protein CAPTEDRAFT_221699 [Capitella teleta]
MVCLESTSLPQTSQLKSVSQKKKTQRKKLRMREYCNLKAIVPALASKQSVTKVTVVEEAIKYIDELQMALCGRLYANDHEKDEVSAPYMATVEECSYPEPSPRPQEILVEVNPHYDPRCHSQKTVNAKTVNAKTVNAKTVKSDSRKP